jgi:hypothetical protein
MLTLPVKSGFWNRISVPVSVALAAGAETATSAPAMASAETDFRSVLSMAGA